MMAAAATAQKPVKKEGDISDSFVSLSVGDRPPLPDRFRELKRQLVRGRERQMTESWVQLLGELRRENEIVASKGPSVIPQVEFGDLERGIESLQDEIRKRGTVVIKGVIPEAEARAYKGQIEDYVAKNPSTKAFPQNDPQVFELYWSEAQLKARSHPNFLRVQQQLMSSLWHVSSPTAAISLEAPLLYADRLRIRQPGDSHFALGPHIDGGSVERWERNGYGLGGVYDAIFAGRWDEYDPWDASGRVDAVNNLYDGQGACSMFRMWQGWLGMSQSRPNEGTLLVNPLVKLSTAYCLLRPFFSPLRTDTGKGYLDSENWVLTPDADMTSELQGATPGFGQELNDELHPHLELERTMVHVPDVKPGDFVAWHCDAIHAVDKVHGGSSDASVLYIPVCPVTDLNAEYLARQRAAFRAGTPAPDFPGGAGESTHVGRPTEAMFREWAGSAGRRAMGLERLQIDGTAARPGAFEVVARANKVLGL